MLLHSLLTAPPPPLFCESRSSRHLLASTEFSTAVSTYNGQWTTLHSRQSSSCGQRQKAPPRSYLPQSDPPFSDVHIQDNNQAQFSIHPYGRIYLKDERTRLTLREKGDARLFFLSGFFLPLICPNELRVEKRSTQKLYSSSIIELPS